MEIGVCKLCLKERPLVKRSMIIPKFFQKQIFTGFEPVLVGIESLKYQKRKSPYGVYEQNILCETCDNEIIGKFETYGRLATFGDPTGRVNIYQKVHIGSDGLRTRIYKGLNYKKFKLFILSVLWRSSISNQDFFKNVSLGPHEEVIRKMILSGDPKAESKYSILLLEIDENHSQLPIPAILSPMRVKEGVGTHYVFFIGRFFYHINISNNTTDSIFKKSNILSENGFIEIPVLQGEVANLLFDTYTNMKARLKSR